MKQLEIITKRKDTNLKKQIFWQLLVLLLKIVFEIKIDHMEIVSHFFFQVSRDLSWLMEVTFLTVWLNVVQMITPAD